MKSWFQRILEKRYLQAIFAGVLLALAFPKMGVAGFAWIAPGLMLFAARNTQPAKSFRLGYVAGFSYFLCGLYWLLLIPLRVAGFPLMPMIGWLALSGFLALYPAIWVWLCSRISTTELPDENIAPKNSNWLSRAIFAIQCAVIWVALEMIQTRFLSGFPWDLLGVSQAKLTPLIQIASFTGVYGVSFLIVWFSVSLLGAARILIKNPTAHRAWLAEIAVPALAIILISVWGYQRITQPRESRPELKLALVQPSIEQEVIWDESKNGERFAKLMALSEKALAEKPDVLVWPEAAMPGLTAENFIAITNLISTSHVWMIFGADDVEQKLEANKGFDFFNASFLFDPQGNYVSTYRKMRLVMFGEYIPFSRWFPFLQKLVPIGNFSPGKGPVPFQISEPRAKTTVLICFEDVFPHYTRAYVESDTDFLLNLTNDGWFGRSAAQWQHAMTAIFRAVENGIPLVRCTNNGLTCWADEFGVVRQIFSAKENNVYGAGYLIARIPLLKSGEKREPTFYNRYGDLFGWSCVVVTIILIAQTSWLERRKIKGE